MKKERLGYGTYFLAFGVSVLVLILLLMLSSALPQERVDEKVLESALIMYEEGVYPNISDRTATSKLDNWTDSIMLMVSRSMDNIASVLSNPIFDYGKENPVETLYEYAQQENPEPAGYYVRYWMGFRALLRLGLVFLNYYQIKRYLSFAFFILFAAVICSVAKHFDIKKAFLFALSIIMVKPYIICSSLQYSCCFLIAFAAMTMVPWLNEHPKYDALFFLEIGIITMFADFYTTPIVTFGLPAVYLYLLRAQKRGMVGAKELLRSAAAWFCGYGFMWLAKLLLATAFTPVNGFNHGFSSLIGWLSSGEAMGAERIKSLFAGLIGVAYAVLGDKEGAVLICIVGLVIALLLAREMLQKRVDFHALKRAGYLLVIASLPVIWFIVAAKPTSGHYYFQYRGISVFYWAVGVWLSMVFPGRETPAREIRGTEE